MILQTGGLAFSLTSTKSNSLLEAISNAFTRSITPSCCPSESTTLSSGYLILSLIFGSSLTGARRSKRGRGGIQICLMELV